MSEIRDFFIKTLDETDTGIVNMMRKVTEKLNENDPAIQNCLVKNEIFPQYYSFRQVQYILIFVYGINLYYKPFLFCPYVHICLDG